MAANGVLVNQAYEYQRMGEPWTVVGESVTTQMAYSSTDDLMTMELTLRIITRGIFQFSEFRGGGSPYPQSIGHRIAECVNLLTGIKIPDRLDDAQLLALAVLGGDKVAARALVDKCLEGWIE